MAIPTAGLAVAAILLSGYVFSPAESPDPGSRVESDSFTKPVVLARCITHNIKRKQPDLLVRNRPSDASDGTIYLVLSIAEPSPTTFGVIRVDQSETGSHLTTWLPTRSLTAAPTEIARKLVAGC